MARSKSILASVLTLVLLAAPLAPARAGKPQPPPPAPKLVAVVEGGMQVCVALFAIDDRGTVYVDCGVTGNWQVAGQVPGVPVSMMYGAYPRNLLVTMANGDVWAAPVTPTPPYTFTMLSNVFAAAGTGARPVALAPLEDARPILTGDGASLPDVPGAIK